MEVEGLEELHDGARVQAELLARGLPHLRAGERLATLDILQKRCGILQGGESTGAFLDDNTPPPSP